MCPIINWWNCLSGRTALHLAVQWGHEQCVTELIKAGINIDEKSKSGMTALYYASQMNQIGVLPKLVDTGADLHITKSGRTALHYAAYNGSKDTVTYLVKQGLSAYKKDDYGETPIDSAGRGGHHEIVSYLQKSTTLDLTLDMTQNVKAMVSFCLPSSLNYIVSSLIIYCTILS